LKTFVQKLKIIAAIIILSLLVLFTISENMFKANKKLCYNDMVKLPENKVGLLLGTSKYRKTGGQNVFYKNRINAAVKLYKAGKIKYIISTSGSCRSILLNSGCL